MTSAITQADAARLLRVSRQRINQLIRDGKLQAIHTIPAKGGPTRQLVTLQSIRERIANEAI